MVGGDRLAIYHANHLQWRSGSHVKLEKTFNSSEFPAGSRLNRGATMAESWQPTLMGTLSVVSLPHAAVGSEINDFDVAGHVHGFIGRPNVDVDCMASPPSDRPLQLLASLPCCSCRRRLLVPPSSATVGDKGEGELPLIAADLTADHCLAAHRLPATSARCRLPYVRSLDCPEQPSTDSDRRRWGCLEKSNLDDVMLVAVVVVGVQPRQIGGRLIVVVTLPSSNLHIAVVGERCRTITSPCRRRRC
ncbi:hypothetical protein ACLOJK_015178 [Asimina triloba]